MHGLLKNAEVRWVKAAVAAANNTDSNSAIIDTQGYESVMFVVPITGSVATGVAKIQIEENDANADAGMVAVSGAMAQAVSAGTNDIASKVLVAEYVKPRKRYVQAVITSQTANVAFGEMVAVLVPFAKPAQAGATVLASGLGQG